MAKKSLSREDWLAAGFRYLAKTGPTSVQINPIAAELGATKGSFYWHFKDITEYKSALLITWKEKAATEIITTVSKESDPEARLDALIEAATASAPDLFGGRSIEPAMRAWALSDSDAKTTLRDIDAARLSFLSHILSEAGYTDPELPALCYSAYIGQDDLASKGAIPHQTGLAKLVAFIRASAKRS